MNTSPPPAGAKQSLNDHVADKGAAIYAKYGPNIGWSELQQILLDRALVRYPCEIVFTAEGLREGEVAYPHPQGGPPEEGFSIRVHPIYMTELRMVPYLVLYQLVAVNYGEFAAIDDAETFAAAALGLAKDDYYNTLCQLADQLGECGGRGGADRAAPAPAAFRSAQC